MRNLVRLVCGLALSLCGAMAASAEGPWYVSGGIGGYFREGTTIDTTFFELSDRSINASGTNMFSFNQGYILSGAIGYRVSRQWRIETEIGYDAYEVNHINPLTQNANFPNLDGRSFGQRSGADYSRVTGSLNGFYDFTLIASAFTPYVGGGVGVSDNHRSTGEFVSSNGINFRSNADGGGEGFGLLEAGFNIALSRHLSIVPAFRYVHFFSAGQDVASVGKLGLRYVF